jgi:hypothetical protein
VNRLRLPRKHFLSRKVAESGLCTIQGRAGQGIAGHAGCSQRRGDLRRDHSRSELAREIRPGLPVVYSSGYALELLTQQGRARARAIFLVKPYRKAELAERLREALTTNLMVS